MATIFHVAEKAGVSITTVSRALNGYSDVNEDTRRRVVEIAGELNYYPSAAARSLRGKRTNTIVFAPQVHAHIESEPFFKEFIGALALACFIHDLSLLVTVADSPKDTRELYRGLAGSRRADGIILADVEPDDERIQLLQEIHIPFVAFGRTTRYGDLTYPFVDVDGAAGMQALVAHLYRQGHRRIAYFSGPFSTSYALHRYSGYQQGLRQHGLVEDARCVVHELQDRAETQAAVARLFALPRDEHPTAIVASSDRLALDVHYALQAAGLSIGRSPGQIAVTGFDDLPFAAYVHPGLTTVRQPLDATCATLLDLLVILIKHKSEPIPQHAEPGLTWLGPQQILLVPELVIRDSA
ncbi:MAG TPA: LacI family DNA-binding transcriptional regulator [Chloroflexia bacterium]|nr:LacI family DNA-binding transcriptional regulator [Chloroflexia bacterium]